MMMKVLVVDDEVRQRKSIIRHVDWQRYEMEVTGEAEDAREALALAESDAPDLLITDIRLIGMSGLELCARMRSLHAGMRIIMVTGYEEFEYAKTALDLGVDAFLVKPIDFNQLGVTLEQMYQEKLLSKKKQEEEAHIRDQLMTFTLIARENMLHELIHGLILNENDIKARAQALNMMTADATRSIVIVALDPLSHSSYSQEETMRSSQAAIRKRAEQAYGSLLEETTTTPRGDFVLILKDVEQGQGQSQSQSHSKLAVEQILETFEAGLSQLGSCKISIGIGKPADSLIQLGESFQLAQRAVNLRLLGRMERVFYWHEIVEQPEFSGRSVDEMTDDFFEMMGAGDSQGSRSTLGDLMRRMIGDVHIHGSEMRSLCLDLVSRASRVAGEVGDAGKHLGSEKALWKELLDCKEELELLQTTIRILTAFCDYVAERKKSGAQVIVHKALEYMNSRYKDNLTLGSVADAVFLSPNYLGALLRTELGQSFTDLLIKIRIGNAKQLLQNPQMKLYEVAENVGYQNIGYFTGLFKRITGYTPKEYRNFIGTSTSAEE